MDALYGEAGEDALQRVLTHHAQCRTCRDEFEGLRSLRRTLAGWRLPEQQRPWLVQRRMGRLPALAAAAALALAVGAALRMSGASLEYRSGPVTVRLGPPSSNLEGALREQETRHREEIQALRGSLEAVSARLAAPPDDAALFAKVQQLVRENEERQAARFNTSLEAFAARSEAQRRYDQARVLAGLSYLDGKAGQHVARTSELMGYVLQASEKR
jgi:hypothetical protein